MMNNQMDHFINTQFQRLPELSLEQVQLPALPTDISERKLWIVGSGSSLNAAEATRQYFTQTATIETPELFLAHLPQQSATALRHSVFISISQTASSIATMTTLKKMRAAGAYTILVTANHDFQNQTVADATIDINAAEELIGPKSLGYTATVVRLMQVATKLSGRPMPDLASTFQLLPKVKQVAEQWLQAHQAWNDAQFFTLATSEAFVPAARECTLKLLEVIRKPAAAYELGEFTHGPHRLFGPMAAHIFITNQADTDFASRIASFARQQQARTLELRMSDVVEPDLQGDVVDLPAGVGSTLILAVFFQTLANELAALAGIDADTLVLPGFFTAVGTKVDFTKTEDAK